jgi:ABC-type branched-subunit amino acid transport system substrate-binding protein
MTEPSASPALPLAAGTTPSSDDPQRLETTPPTTPAPLSATPVGSRYLLDYLIGQGAWGRVWHGRRRSDGAPVAIKVLRAEYAADPEVVSRLLRERTLLQALRHPHLVQVEDLVVEGDTFAVVMELVDGVDLRRVAQRGELDLDEALTVLAQVAQALAHIHAEGVLHRDVKPENILVSRRDGRVWAQLTDFGLAWLADGQRLTVVSHVLGTPAYLAPELLSGHPYGPAVDVYALGVTAYELLCGHRPFNGEHPMALMRAHLDDQPARPPGMAEHQWRVIHACLAKDPRQRPTAAQVTSEVEDLRDDRGVRLCIDFGTCTTAAVLCWPDGRVEPLRFDDSTLLPSAVYADPDGAMLTGGAALAAASEQPQRCEPYPRLRIANGSVPLGERELDPVDLVAAVLRRVAQQAQHHAGGPPARTTLTHPATWGAAKLALLLRAARQAGLPGPQLVPEPVAAAAHLAGAPATDLPADAYAVLYDFGAATTRASVLRRATDGGFDVVATEELSDAGGIDIDAAVLDHLGEIFAADAPQDWLRLSQPESPPDRYASWWLWRDVQHAKEILSRSTTTSVHVPLVDRHVSLDRELLDRLARPILERTIGAVYTALASAGVAAADLAAIFPIGGASRMPLVATVLRQALGQAPTALPQPDLVVAQGAAHLPPQAASVDGGTARGGRGPGRLTPGPPALPPALPPAELSDSRPDAGLAQHGVPLTRTRAHRRRAGRGRDVRRRRVRVWADLRRRPTLVAAATMLLLAGVATVGYESLPAHSTVAPGTAACGYKIAYLGSPTGFLANAAGSPDGLALAVEEYNAQHPGCTVELVPYSPNDPAGGDAIDTDAREIGSDPKILGVVSPLYLSETQIALPILDQAGVATISPTLTVPADAQSGYGVFHRTVGTDVDDVTAGIRQLTHQLNARRTFVVDDGTANSVRGATYAQHQLGTAALAGTVSMGRSADYSALINQITASKADAVYYTGLSDQFGAFVDFVAQLRGTKPDITIFGWQWAYNDQFVPAAGHQPPDNIYVTCTCMPPDRIGHDFTERFVSRYRTAPTWYAAEAFDAANVLLSGLSAGRNTRSTMLDWVNRYDGDGVSGHIKFSSTGDLVAPTTWTLRYVHGAIVAENPIGDDLTAR